MNWRSMGGKSIKINTRCDVEGDVNVIREKKGVEIDNIHWH